MVFVLVFRVGGVSVGVQIWVVFVLELRCWWCQCLCACFCGTSVHVQILVVLVLEFRFWWHCCWCLDVGCVSVGV